MGDGLEGREGGERTDERRRREERVEPMDADLYHSDTMCTVARHKGRNGRENTERNNRSSVRPAPPTLSMPL